MSAPKDATVTTVPGKLPIFGPGNITALACSEFVSAVRNYFLLKDTAEEKRVGILVGCFEEPKVKNWLRPTAAHTRLTALSLNDFMTKFKTKFLPVDWVEKTRKEVLSSRMSEHQTFDEWSTHVNSLAALLQDDSAAATASALQIDDKCLRHTLEAGMLEDLHHRVSAAPAAKIPDDQYDEWTRAVTVIDLERVYDDAKIARMLATAASASDKAAKRKANTEAENERVTKKPFDNSRKGNITNSSAPTSSSASSSSFCPPLTENERNLLKENDGCNKCRKFFVGHQSKTCPNDYPKAATYATLTQADVDAAKKGKSKAVAVVMHGIDKENDSSDDDVQDEVSDPAHGHFYWDCLIEGPMSNLPLMTTALIDNGAHLVLINEDYVDKLQLRRFKLLKPEPFSLAIDSPTAYLYEYVKIPLTSRDQSWSSSSVRALIARDLCCDIILGIPWLARNNIVIDHSARTVVDKKTNYDLLNPVAPKPTPPRRERPIEKRKRTKRDHIEMARELKAVCAVRRERLEAEGGFEIVKPFDVIAAVREQVETLAHCVELTEKGEKIRNDYPTLFEPVPHIDFLPKNVVCEIKVKQAEHDIETRTYQSPRKYKDAWQTLIQTHLEAGRIHPSTSPHASPALLIPKADKTALPRWVNDFRRLNAITIRDAFPLPRVNDILADCAKGKIWSVIDFTDSFFQTRLDEESIKYTAVSTPLGLYEWLVMPQGLKNAPAVQQRRVTAALREFIGKTCHVYLDDIVIWSEDVRAVFEALRKAGLYCNLKKTKLFQYEIDFLGHHISQRGIEADTKKVERIMNWPQPKTSTNVRAFLGLVRYISKFLPDLATWTPTLENLTTKECDKDFPEWNANHQRAFDEIKRIVVSRDCLTVIDHENRGENKIFVTADASDKRSGALLSYGETWESARPVAFESTSFKDAELNYPIHEKELLAIIRALKKWRVDLIGNDFTIFTDHRTLESFDTQKDLSRRQARWMEFLSQFEYSIVYLKGEDNTVADALSRTEFDESNAAVEDAWKQTTIASVLRPCTASPFLTAQCLARTRIKVPTTNITSPPIASVLKISSDASILASIKAGYASDPWCAKLESASKGMPGLEFRLPEGLWYVADRLIVPRVGDIRQTLFHLAHDTLGHFGFDKCYKTLRDCYYWPNMHRDLEEAYIPSCPDCQRNKSGTKKPAGPLHPNPIPEKRGDSVAIDFIGPLPTDQGFNCIASFTDRLGADIRLVPTRTDISAEDFALLFFDNWYCENGLPLDIFSDRDKLFVLAFWKALHKLTGVKLKMSTAFHPETDGASERTNKTVNQAVRYHVARNQRGWVRALPRVRFDMMNTVNASIGFSGFQLRMGRSPRVIPPLVVTPNATLPSEDRLAAELIARLDLNVVEAQENLLAAKISQAKQANKTRRTDHDIKVGDRVKLTTAHRRANYVKKGDGRVAKYMPRFDGPYKVIAKHTECSTYTLDLHNQPNVFPVFHASELEPFIENDDDLFPERKLAEPEPILNDHGEKEWFTSPKERSVMYVSKPTGLHPPPPSRISPQHSTVVSET
jgi:hypothetical protein